MILPASSFSTRSHFDDIGVFQPHFLANSQAEIFVVGSDFHEILLLDIQLSGEGDLVRALAAGKVLCRHHLGFALGVVFNDELERAQHTHQPRRMGIEIFPDAML